MISFKSMLIFLIFLHFYIVNAAIQDDKKIFCMYLTKSSERQGEGHFKVDNINEHYCTHLIYAYFGVNDNGQIISMNRILDFDENNGRSNIRRFNNKKHYNTKLKTIAAIGGWDTTETSKRYSEIFRDEQFQNNFVKSAVEFLLKYNFNGLALHWTYPGIHGGDPITDKYTITSVLRKLKQEFSKRNLILVAICHGLTSQIEVSYIPRDISNNVDYIYLTSYDLYGEWSQHIGIASGLYLHPNEPDKGLSADSVINNWLNRGADQKKIIMGIPLFGRTFTLKYDNQTTPGSSHIGPGLKTQYVQYAGLTSYMELCQKLNDESWTIKWEDTQKNPYAFKENQWVSYENPRSLQIKSNYVIDKNLAGVAAVFIEDDDFKGNCGEKFALLKVLNEHLRMTSEPEFEYLLNVSVFKKNLRSQYIQCVYHNLEVLDLI